MEAGGGSRRLQDEEKALGTRGSGSSKQAAAWASGQQGVRRAAWALASVFLTRMQRAVEKAARGASDCCERQAAASGGRWRRSRVSATGVYTALTGAELGQRVACGVNATAYSTEAQGCTQAPFRGRRSSSGRDCSGRTAFRSASCMFITTQLRGGRLCTGFRGRASCRFVRSLGVGRGHRCVSGHSISPLGRGSWHGTAMCVVPGAGGRLSAGSHIWVASTASRAQAVWRPV